MNILLFGVTKDIVGSSSLSIPVAKSNAPKTVGDLRQYLGRMHPDLLKLSSLAIAVNNNYAEDETKIDTFDEIALIPPVSGG